MSKETLMTRIEKLEPSKDKGVKIHIVNEDEDMTDDEIKAVCKSNDADDKAKGYTQTLNIIMSRPDDAPRSTRKTDIQN